MTTMHTLSLPSRLLMLHHRLRLAVGPAAPQLTRSLVALLLAAILQGIAFSCLYPIVAIIIDGQPIAGISVPATVMTITGLLSLALRWYGQGFEYAGHLANATYALRLRLGEKLRSISLEALQQTRAGEMNAVLLGSIDEHFNYVIAIANTAFTSIVTPLTVTAITAVINVPLALALLVMFPLMALLNHWQRPMKRRHISELVQANERLSGDIVEFVQGLETLRFCGEEEARYAAIRDRCHAFKRLQQRLHRDGANATLLTSSAIELSLLGVVCLGVLWVISGSLALPALMTAMIIISRFSEPMASFISQAVVLELLSSTLHHLQRLLDTPALPVLPGAAEPDSFEVTFDQVTFRYAQAPHDAVNTLSTHFESGRTSAVVGASGAGKSTVAKLLQRYADPQHGTVRIGGVDIRTLTAQQLNRYISVVFQDVFLFNETVLANLWMARPEASREEVQEAARQAQCLEVIERLPEGWQTHIENAGVTLSGGERQRLSIARALLKDTPIVVLDEPTASLDMANEHAVQRALERLAQGRTVVLITHRLATLMAADTVYFMQQGTVTDHGSHTELMARNAVYRALWSESTD
ncbi:ABC transporter ATP-binding protein [Zymobacter sp. IVIA_5232.4 C2]|uniref:ABC transporter ATP-binding protein n=1 Tax=Zymobacter sp. IVIA_5232.4 C2 TaxID=3394855 RepID=UPI0039C3FCF7